MFQIRKLSYSYSSFQDVCVPFWITRKSWVFFEVRHLLVSIALDRLKSPKTKLWDRTRNLAKLCLKCVSYGNLGFLGLIHTEDLSFHFISCATLKISFLFIYLNKSTGSVIKFIYDADFKDLNVAIKLLYLKSRFIKSFTQLELRPLREPILCEQTKHRALAIWYKINHARPHF